MAPLPRALVPDASVERLVDAGSGAPSAFDPQPWLDDLSALIAALSSHYANLDYAIHGRRMDLAAVRTRTEARLRAATTADEAKAAFRSFQRAFGDGHLSIDWTPSPPPSPAAPPTSAPLCKRLGYAPREPGGVDFALAGVFTPTSDADADLVPGGVLQLAGGPTLGVVRIGLFSSKSFPRLCEEARAASGVSNDAACDDECDSRMELATDDLLTAALDRRLLSLQRAGAAAIVVDLTGNGGGSDWVEPVMRELTPIPIPAAVTGAVRHPHSVATMRRLAADVRASLVANGDLDGGLLGAAARRMDAEIAQLNEPCDLQAAWQPDAALPACTQLVRIEPVIAYAKPGSLTGRVNAEALFGPSRFHYREGAIHLPVAVLVDGGTASAAEDLAEKLQDNHAATIVGTETLGAGCGFMNGGIPTVLPRSGARVKMPDCARFRADGSNAVAGVHPDVALPLLDRDSPYQRAAKVTSGLRAAWRALVARPPRR